MQLNVEGNEVNVVLNEYQTDPLKGTRSSCRLPSDQYDRKT